MWLQFKRCFLYTDLKKKPSILKFQNQELFKCDIKYVWHLLYIETQDNKDIIEFKANTQAITITAQSSCLNGQVIPEGKLKTT